MHSMIVRKISFEEILPFWNLLWPNRKSKILEMSSMTYLGGYDISIYQKYKPTFFGLYIDNKIIGVNSGHKTKKDYYRSRGLWIDSLHRGSNLSLILLKKVDDQAIFENCKYVWSIPRQGALSAYIKNNYIQKSNFFNENVEFGPNCYVLKEL